MPDILAEEEASYETRAADTLAVWRQVYAGLSEADVTEVEALALGSHPVRRYSSAVERPLPTLAQRAGGSNPPYPLSSKIPGPVALDRGFCYTASMQ